jgi:tetratricopeptide (TPR) repeat protein
VGPVHEVIWPAIHRAGLPVRPGGVSVDHRGYADPLVHAGKRRRNERLLLARLAECADDPFALWHLGRIAAGRGLWAVALELYRRSLAGWPADLLAHAPRGHLAQAEWELGDHRAALRSCSQSLALTPSYAPAWFARGQMHDCLGETAEAERCWRRVLTLAGGKAEGVADYDPSFESARARRALASLAIRRGDVVAAARLYGAILAENPDDHEARARLDALNTGLDAGG